MGLSKAVVGVPLEDEIGTQDTYLDNEEKAKFINEYGGHIKYIAQRLAMRLPSHVSVDDLVGAGMIGFIDALDKFDPSKEVKFKTYMEIRVKGAMLDELRTMDPVSRTTRRKAQKLAEAYDFLEKTLCRSPSDEELAMHLDLNLDEFYKILDETKSINLVPLEYIDYEDKDKEASLNPYNLADTEEKSPFHQLQKKELIDLLATTLEELPENEKLVITLYYYEQLTMKEIGKVLSLSESRVSQIHSKAMIHLRYRLGQLGCY